MEACEQIMIRGEADFLLCHYHRDAGAVLDPSQFTSVVVGKDVLLPVCAPDPDGDAAMGFAWSSEETLAIPPPMIPKSALAGS